jgi:hypothetical protein
VPSAFNVATTGYDVMAASRAFWTKSDDSKCAGLQLSATNAWRGPLPNPGNLDEIALLIQMRKSLLVVLLPHMGSNAVNLTRCSVELGRENSWGSLRLDH